MKNPVCPTGCETPTPAVSFSACAPEVNAAEISKLWITSGNGLADVSDASEWLARLSQDGTDEGAIRELTVIGDKPRPSVTKIDISGGRKAVTSRNHVINADIDETNDINHEFVRKLQCGGEFRLWYTTSEEKNIYGGNDGIEVSIDADMVIERSRGGKVVFGLIIEWINKFLEERHTSPFYVSPT